MNKLIRFFHPENQNTAQKIGFFVSISIPILFVFLHFPFDGYKWKYYIGNNIDGSGIVCSKNMTVNNAPELYVNICQDETRRKTISWLKWQSKSPVVLWFSTIGNTITAVFFMLFLGVFWVFVFNNKKDG